MDMVGTQVLHIKTEVLDMVWHNMLSILKYPGIIGYHAAIYQEYANKTGFGST